LSLLDQIDKENLHLSVKGKLNILAQEFTSFINIEQDVIRLFLNFLNSDEKTLTKTAWHKFVHTESQVSLQRQTWSKVFLPYFLNDAHPVGKSIATWLKHHSTSSDKQILEAAINKYNSYETLVEWVKKAYKAEKHHIIVLLNPSDQCVCGYAILEPKSYKVVYTSIAFSEVLSGMGKDIQCQMLLLPKILQGTHNRVFKPLKWPNIGSKQDEVYSTRIDRYKYIKFLSAGALGSAHVVQDLETKQKLVIKQISRRNFEMNEVENLFFLRDVCHPDIVCVGDFWMEKTRKYNDPSHAEDAEYEPTSVYFTMEYLPNYVTLDACFGSRFATPPKQTFDHFVTFKERLDIFFNIVKVAHKLDKLRVCHLDMHGGNIMVCIKGKNKGKIKLIDFGNSKSECTWKDNGHTKMDLEFVYLRDQMFTPDETSSIESAPILYFLNGLDRDEWIY
jgi:hypothetical protein